jgi:hypothetical protein
MVVNSAWYELYDDCRARAVFLVRPWGSEKSVDDRHLIALVLHSVLTPYAIEYDDRNEFRVENCRTGEILHHHTWWEQEDWEFRISGAKRRGFPGKEQRNDHVHDYGEVPGYRCSGKNENYSRSHRALDAGLALYDIDALRIIDDQLTDFKRGSESMSQHNQAAGESGAELLGVPFGILRFEIPEEACV